MKVRVTLSDGFKTALVILFLSISLVFSPRNLSEKPKELEIPDIGNVYFTSTAVDPEPEEIEVIPEPEPIVELIPEPVEPEFEGVSEEDIELIALVTMAEAEGECEKGKRLVIDTILNRVDSKHFPDTVYDVVYQKNQFTSMWNGRVDRCYVKEDICQLVREELESRTNTEVVFFRAGKYGRYGTPLFQVGGHYFSSY